MAFGWRKKKKQKQLEAEALAAKEQEVEAAVEEVEAGADELEIVAEEATEEIIEGAIEETAEEPLEEAPEEAIQEAVEETEELPTQEAVEEPEEEAVQEAVEETEELPTQEAVEELVGETAEEPVEESVEESTEPSEQTEKKVGFFKRLVAGLTKTRDNIVSGFDNIFSGFSKIDDDFYEEIEEVLIMGDIGVKATQEIIESLQEKVAEKHIKKPEECRELLMDSIKEQMQVGETAYRFEEEKSVVLIIGVNGVGKTTTVGKLAGKLKGQGKRVIMAAADTFRAAAGEQLTEWAHRAGVEIVNGQDGADPGAVVFDAVQAAKARKADVLICDTAGRLHNKKNLMEELKKINRILEKEYPDAYRETLVVLDGTTGQNALAQARQFSEVADITGIVLTKLDGTAKGGIAVAIHSELGIPVKYIGVGETIDDLEKFDANEFVNALFDTTQN